MDNYPSDIRSYDSDPRSPFSESGVCPECREDLEYCECCQSCEQAKEDCDCGEGDE